MLRSMLPAGPAELPPGEARVPDRTQALLTADRAAKAVAAPGQRDALAPLSAVYIEYQAPWQLRLLLPDEGLLRLNRVFSLLLRLKAVHGALMKVRKWGWVQRRRPVSAAPEEEEGDDVEGLRRRHSDRQQGLYTRQRRAAAAVQPLRLLEGLESLDELEAELSHFLGSIHQVGAPEEPDASG